MSNGRIARTDGAGGREKENATKHEAIGFRVEQRLFFHGSKEGCGSFSLSDGRKLGGCGPT